MQLMAQKFYQKASVQVAIVSGIIALTIAAMHIWFNYSAVNSRNEDLVKETDALRANLDNSKAEIQRLETLLTPFRTIALERYTGPEQEALSKLAQRIRSLEDQVKDVEKFKEIASKYEFAPLESALKQNTVELLSKASGMFNQNDTEIHITHESWTTPSTRKFAEQLASMMREAGFNVTGPEFATVYLIGDVHPIEWGYNESQYEMLKYLYSTLSPIMSCDNGAKRKLKGEINFRIHFAGQAVFESNGKVKIK
jgi:cell division protein FtsB